MFSEKLGTAGRFIVKRKRGALSFTEANLPSVVNKFLTTASQTLSAHFVLLVGLPTVDGTPSMTTFESKPREGSSKFTKSKEWKDCGFEGIGFNKYVEELWPAPGQKSSKSSKRRPGHDLIFKYKTSVDPNNPDAPVYHLPILAKLPAMITLDRLRPAWRQYIIDMLEAQLDNTGGVSWAKLENEPEKCIKDHEDVDIVWGDPSRVNAEELKANWNWCYQHQREREEGVVLKSYQWPFEFLPYVCYKPDAIKDRYTHLMAEARVKREYVDLSDDDDENEASDEESDDDDPPPPKTTSQRCTSSRKATKAAKPTAEEASDEESDGEDSPPKTASKRSTTSRKAGKTAKPKKARAAPKSQDIVPSSSEDDDEDPSSGPPKKRAKMSDATAKPTRSSKPQPSVKPQPSSKPGPSSKSKLALKPQPSSRRSSGNVSKLPFSDSDPEATAKLALARKEKGKAKAAAEEPLNSDVDMSLIEDLNAGDQPAETTSANDDLESFSEALHKINPLSGDSNAEDELSPPKPPPAKTPSSEAPQAGTKSSAPAKATASTKRADSGLSKPAGSKVPSGNTSAPDSPSATKALAPSSKEADPKTLSMAPPSPRNSPGESTGMVATTMPHVAHTDTAAADAGHSQRAGAEEPALALAEKGPGSDDAGIVATTTQSSVAKLTARRLGPLVSPKRPQKSLEGGAKPGSKAQHSSTSSPQQSAFSLPTGKEGNEQPEQNSPAASMLGNVQLPFLRSLCPLPEYQYILDKAILHLMVEGAYKPEIPEYLRWTHPKEVLSDEFHSMDLVAFQRLLEGLAISTLVSGQVTHATGLAFGLIYRELQRALFKEPGDPDEIESSFDSSYYDAFHQRLTSLHQMVETQMQEAPASPASFGKAHLLQDVAGDSAVTHPPQRPPSLPPAFAQTYPSSKAETGGFIIPDPPVSPAGEDGSPGAVIYDRRALAAFLIGLSKLEVYQNATTEIDLTKILKKPWEASTPFCLSWMRPTYYAGPEFHASSEGMRKMISDVVNGAKARSSKELRHTDLVAFGLAFRDISAAVRLHKQEPVEPPLDIVSSLSEDDFKFAVESLEDVLRWSGHPCYLPGVEGGRRAARAAPLANVPAQTPAQSGKRGAFAKRGRRGQK
ncbi:hypothetical protein HWV62_21080 [Athelia sp. TMB]|nr:hypothetical protein HWV62_21080 [Athelia sp. TMB]